jgi:hypothetical protein
MGKYFVYDREGFLLSPYESNIEAISAAVMAIHKSRDFGGSIPVISDERLSGNPHSGGFDSRQIAERIKAAFPEAKILCVIREQRDMILSAYYQYLRIGGVDTVDKYLTRRYDGRRPGFSPAHFRYVELIAHYRDLFTPGRVLVLPYELFKTDARQFLKKIGDFVSADLPENLAASATHVVLYRRITDAITPRFPWINLFANSNSVNAHSPFFMPKSGKLLLAVNRMLAPTRADRYADKLRGRVDAIVKDRYERSNRELSNMIGIDLSAFGYHGG